MKIPKNKIIKIFWHDHTSNNEWKDEDELREWGDKEYKQLCYTIGECVVNTPKYIIITNEIDTRGNYGNHTLIIKGCIEKITVL